MNVCISRDLKEELALAIDKRLQVVSYEMLFKTVIPLKKKAVLNLIQYCMHYYVTLSKVL